MEEMTKGAGYVLAMYDIRGKQEFIYRSSSIKEIEGGSALLRDCFQDYLLPAAEAVSANADKDAESGSMERRGMGIYAYDTQAEEPESFSWEKMQERFEEGWIGEIVYNGGGNFILVFKTKEWFQKVTKDFTTRLMKSVPTLKVLASCVPIDGPEDYRSDSNRLYARHRDLENRESTIMPWGSLPIIQVDPQTSFPLTHVHYNSATRQYERVSAEAFAKYKKWEKEKDNANPYLKGGEILDKMVTEKDRDSWLAVIFIDGNNMGAKVQNHMEGCNSDYDSQINRLRLFSRTIQKVYVDDRLEDIDKELRISGETGKDGSDSYRMVVFAGDEVTFIVNAHDAFSCAKTYLDHLPKDRFSSCAGIALFRSHAPYAEAYHIAEECCENGKKVMKKDGLTEEVNFLDFHICQGAIGTELKQIRRHEMTEDCISRPWLICGDLKETDVHFYTSMEDVLAVEDYFLKLGRSNIKSIPEAARESEAAFLLELERIEAHADGSEGRKSEEKLVRPELPGGMEQLRWLSHDMALCYDFWGESWKDMKEKDGETNQEAGDQDA